MEQKILAAIVGAITAYIQQEESAREIYSGKNDAWWLLGQRRQMNSAANTRQAMLLPGMGAWRNAGLERSMITGTRWKINKIGGKGFSAW